MSIANNLDDLIGRLEKMVPGGMTAGLSVPEAKVLVTDVGTLCPTCKKPKGDCKCKGDCGCLTKSEDCGCGKKKSRLVKGDVQEQAFCKKCRGELGKCKCLRKEATCDCTHEGLCKDAKDCGCECGDRATCSYTGIEKSGLDSLIDVLSKQVR